VALAREHESKLRPLLSFLTIRVADEARAEELRISIDGAPLDRAAWGTALAVDPGKHVIEAEAPGKISRSETVVIGANAARQSHLVRPLGTAASPGGEEPPRSTQRNVGIGLGAAGVVAVGVGLGFGWSASKLDGDARSLCQPDGSCPTSAAKDEASRSHASAVRSGNIATVLVAAGLGLGVGGLVIALTARTRTPGSSGARVSGGATRHGAELVLEGNF
jgi:hypothetical protein